MEIEPFRLSEHIPKQETWSFSVQRISRTNVQWRREGLNGNEATAQLMWDKTRLENMVQPHVEGFQGAGAIDMNSTPCIFPSKNSKAVCLVDGPAYFREIDEKHQ